jgi:hypothetical protein
VAGQQGAERRISGRDIGRGLPFFVSPLHVELQ